MKEDGDSPYLLDLQNNTRYELPSKPAGIFFAGAEVSPDGKNLAYVEDTLNTEKQITRQKIWIVNASGKVLASKTILPEVLSREWHWLDNERLEIPSINRTPKDGTIIVFNPFKNDWQYLSNQLPNFYDAYDVDPVWWLVTYNPKLDLVAYLGRADGINLGITIRDISSEKNIWQYPAIPLAYPKWLSFNERFLIFVEKQLYLINRDGDVISLSDLVDKNILDFASSPNGRFIAFWNGNNGRKGDLMVYDVSENQIIDYCINSDSVEYGDISVWSADSKQFVTSVYSKNSEATILVDIERADAYEIPGEMKPVAWMYSDK